MLEVLKYSHGDGQILQPTQSGPLYYLKYEMLLDFMNLLKAKFREYLAQSV